MTDVIEGGRGTTNINQSRAKSPLARKGKRPKRSKKRKDKMGKLIPGGMI